MFAVRTLQRTFVARPLVSSARCMATGSGSHMSDKAPPSKKAHNPAKKDTEHHFNKDGGWAEERASSSEAAVKADRHHHGKHDDPIKLQKESTELLNKKHKKEGR